MLSGADATLLGSERDPAPEDGPAVVYEAVSRRFGRGDRSVTALSEVDLTVEDGEFVVVVGPSGCGKSTLLRLAAGFEQPTTGTVRVRGRQPEPGQEIGVVFQQPRLFPWLNVGANVAFGLRGLSRQEQRHRAEELLALVGLSGMAGRRPWELSGGQQQRVAIARALATAPSLLLMDEPFAALDALTRERLQDELRLLAIQRKMTTVFVTHSVDEAVVLGSRIVVMAAGPGRVVRDVRVNLPRSPDIGGEVLRGRPDYGVLRTEIGAAVRAAARSA